jgi:hypothetical protein
MPLMFLQETPNTVDYLILGYVIICGVGLGYVLSMWLRQRNLKRDLEVIERLQNSDDE